MNESDGIDEMVEVSLRAGLLAAAGLGEQLARTGERALRETRRMEELRVRELRERFETARAAGRAELAPLTREDWWDTATPAMIRQARDTAAAWAPWDPVAAAHVATLQARSPLGPDGSGPTGTTTPDPAGTGNTRAPAAGSPEPGGAEGEDSARQAGKHRAVPPERPGPRGVTDPAWTASTTARRGPPGRALIKFDGRFKPFRPGVRVAPCANRA
ncbi:hypothetical protein [Arthrobacter mobilis]|uniref:Uncharacterized protein n=1 Tax=Arthrobacter mobilis TaxID=2724944 RepID=A0A7X6HGF7_9MICC|nr:hypothetical protein [Arthrobacter mobilis]NKX55920.1 hypothetical protein [Arthrobacter mobilis]